ncbi:protein FRIGIDA [Cicer arietinum]|uniref:FRIGIDA-like protein n=1 Tax=Cicer arietinum TaxID=3827 RepID=A0A1S2YCZ8_CICAR|nr:protein FRIGIDA [Cicer arietinum]
MEVKQSTVSEGSIPPYNEHDACAKIDKSVNELNDLSISIQAFKNRYDELQKHLDFIQQSIDTRTKELEALATTTTVQTATDNGDIVPSEPESKSKAEGEREQQQQQQEPEEEEDPEEEPEEEEEDPEEPEVEEKKPEEEEDELLSLCKTMNSRGLRRYILTHLSETTSLKEQIPVALKTAPQPSKLVLECIGRFYLQGSKAYTTGSPMITARLASVLTLEYYLISGCVENEAQMTRSLKKDAATAAVSWRKRLIMEGGVGTASEMDARGLVLFLASFGVPGIFRNDDIVRLIRLSKPSEISHALRHSNALCSRVSDIAEGMMKKGMVVEAVDLAYTFGFEEKFTPQEVLASFLHKSNEAWKKAKQEARNVPNLLKKGNEKYLIALKSVVDCLEGHKVDFAKLLPEWRLKDTIFELERDIGHDITKKIEDGLVSKRKLDKSNSSKKVKVPDTKRTRFTARDPIVVSPSVTTLQGQRISSHMNGNSSYDGSVTAHYLEGRSYGYPNNYSSPASAQIGPVSGSLPEGFLGRGVSSGGSMIGGAIAGSLSGYQSDMPINNVRTTLDSNSSLYSRLRRIDEGALSYNRSIEQSFVGQPSSARVNHLYGRTSAEGYAVLPDHRSIGVPSRSGGSDLYSFADTVFDV